MNCFLCIWHFFRSVLTKCSILSPHISLRRSLHDCVKRMSQLLTMGTHAWWDYMILNLISESLTQFAAAWLTLLALEICFFLCERTFIKWKSYHVCIVNHASPWYFLVYKALYNYYSTIQSEFKTYISPISNRLKISSCLFQISFRCLLKLGPASMLMKECLCLICLKDEIKNHL